MTQDHANENNSLLVIETPFIYHNTQGGA